MLKSHAKYPMLFSKVRQIIEQNLPSQFTDPTKYAHTKMHTGNHMNAKPSSLCRLKEGKGRKERMGILTGAMEENIRVLLQSNFYRLKNLK